MSSAYVWSKGGLPFAGGEVVDIGTIYRAVERLSQPVDLPKRSAAIKHSEEYGLTLGHREMSPNLAFPAIVPRLDFGIESPLIAA